MSETYTYMDANELFNKPLKALRLPRTGEGRGQQYQGKSMQCTFPFDDIFHFYFQIVPVALVRGLRTSDF